MLLDVLRAPMLSSTVHALALLISSGTSIALNLNVSSTGGYASSPYQYGIMFEDISHSGDGGIYAELIQNRAFQGSTLYPASLAPWSAIGGAALTPRNLSTPISSALPTSIHVGWNGTSTTESVGGEYVVGIRNPGFWGIDVKPQTYQGSFWVSGRYTGKFTASLESALTDDVFATTKIQGMQQKGWTEYRFQLTPERSAPNSNNTFSLTFDARKVEDGSGLDFGLISLFPPTYNNR